MFRSKLQENLKMFITTEYNNNSYNIIINYTTQILTKF